jgi:hypothetical protein
VVLAVSLAASVCSRVTVCSRSLCVARPVIAVQRYGGKTNFQELAAVDCGWLCVWMDWFWLLQAGSVFLRKKVEDTISRFVAGPASSKY